MVREEKYEGIKLQKKTILYNLYINFVKNERNFKIKSFNSKNVVSLHRHLILINYDCRVQNQEFLFVAG